MREQDVVGHGRDPDPARRPTLQADPRGRSRPAGAVAWHFAHTPNPGAWPAPDLDAAMAHRAGQPLVARVVERNRLHGGTDGQQVDPADATPTVSATA